MDREIRRIEVHGRTVIVEARKRVVADEKKSEPQTKAGR